MNHWHWCPYSVSASHCWSVRPVKDSVPEFVDMGLPSGTLWATKNVGAHVSTQCGGFFRWGDVAGEAPYGLSDKYCEDESGTIPAYDIIRSAHDAAYSTYNGWQMPSKEQILELLDNCVWPESSTLPDDYEGSWFIGNWCGCGSTRFGALLVSKNNGNKLYLPLDGFALTRNGTTSQQGINLAHTGYVDALIWSGSYYSTACAAGYDLRNLVDSTKTPEEQRQTIYAYRYYGGNIRPVKRNIREQDTVDLDLPSGTLWCTKNYGADNELERGDLMQWSNIPSDETYAMPTNDQWTELLKNTDWERTTNYNGTFVPGWKVTSKTHTDRSIFLPATGCIVSGVQYAKADNNATIKEGLYWTADTYDDTHANFAQLSYTADGELLRTAHTSNTANFAARQVKNV